MKDTDTRKTKLKIIFIGLLAAMLIALIAGTIWYLLMFSKNDINNFQSYSNSHYKFSLKYPAEWTAAVITQNDGYPGENIIFYIDKDDKGKGYFSLVINNPYNNQMRCFAVNCYEYEVKIQDSKAVLKETNNYTQKTIQLAPTPQTAEGDDLRIDEFEHGGNSYLITFHGQGGSRIETLNNVDAFKKIISTIRFE